MSRVLLLVSAGVCFLSFSVYGQDAGSLGDAARRTRQEKDKQKDKESNPSGNETSAPKGVRVTDDETPQPAQEPAPSSATSDQIRPASNTRPASTGAKQTAEQWKAQIQEQRNAISALQTAIDRLNNSIHFLAAACNSCKRWNERQLEKKQEVERARSRLEVEKKRLAEMQEAARQQGYGGSVYDP